jgi:hypothetical protein
MIQFQVQFQVHLQMRHRGVLLALDMGPARQPSAIAAHALSTTANSEAEVVTSMTRRRWSECCGSGQDEDHMREARLFTGFKQRNDRTRSIAT